MHCRSDNQARIVRTYFEQIRNAEKRGNTELVQKHCEQLDRLHKTRKNLTQGELTSKQAINARLHPELSTGMDIANISHRAGVESAKAGAVIGGRISFINHATAVLKGDEEPSDAALAVVGDTASAAGVSYATGFVGSAIKGGMQNADLAI